MKILVTGATGFTGSYVVRELLNAGHTVCAFVRNSSNTKDSIPNGCENVVGDLNSIETLCHALIGMDAIVNIASLGFGHAPNILKAIQESGVKRCIFISTTAIFTKLNAPSKVIRLQAEKYIIESGLNYTIIRPTMIYGSARDRNMCRLIKFLKRSPLIMTVGNKKALQQPIYVEDIARSVVKILANDITIGRCYNIAGAQTQTFSDIVNIISKYLNKKTLIINLPYGPVVKILRFIEALTIIPKIKAEQIERLNEDKVFDWSAAAKDFNFEPTSFENGIKLEIENLNFI
jgi:nucleoside-diphosphate-sugar epimerase